MVFRVVLGRREGREWRERAKDEVVERRRMNARPPDAQAPALGDLSDRCVFDTLAVPLRAGPSDYTGCTRHTIKWVLWTQVR